MAKLSEEEYHKRAKDLQDKIRELDKVLRPMMAKRRKFQYDLQDLYCVQYPDSQEECQYDDDIDQSQPFDD